MTANKIIFTDLDGTLLNDDKNVSEKNRLALIKALDLGHIVYIATGRPYKYAQHIANQIDPRVKTVSFNGAVYETDRLVIYPIANDKYKDLKDSISKYALRPFYKTIDELYYDGSMPASFEYDHLGMASIEGINQSFNKELIKVLVIQQEVSKQDTENLIEQLSENFSVSYYPDKGFELTEKGLDKGSAVAKVTEYLNIDKKNIVVFGDDVNDLSMFAQAGLSIATENANEVIKKQSDFISLDCNESAIAYGLKHFKII